MSGISIKRFEDCESFRDGNDGQYEYDERPAIPEEGTKHCIVCFYEIPPGKSNYPYHYHLDQEEVFYIINGEGILKTPDGEKRVSAGDLVFFPAGESGAHKLTNASETETLRYIDFDTIAEMDVAVYPDSGKVGIWSEKLNKVFRLADKAGYYDGEET